MKHITFLDSFSGGIADLKRGKRTRDHMVAVLSQSPMVSTWDLSDNAWLRNGIADLEADGIIVSVTQPYPWLRYELTDTGRALMTPNAKVRGDAPLYGAASLSTDGLCNGG